MFFSLVNTYVNIKLYVFFSLVNTYVNIKMYVFFSLVTTYVNNSVHVTFVHSHYSIITDNFREINEKKDTIYVVNWFVPV